MADGAGRVISTSLLLTVLVAASAATSWCLVAANAQPDGGSADQAGGANDRGMMLANRFLATAAARKIGRRTCRPGHPSGACSGAGALGEHRRFKCCGRVCTDVLGSASNCGTCGKRCLFGRLCCAGRCVAVAYDARNCGACGRACAAGMPCTYGMCGYA